MSHSPLIQNLIDALRVLPGVGNKSAQRMAFYLLERDREGAVNLGQALLSAAEKVGHCERCRTLTEQSLCDICANPKRQQGEICIVETPADVYAIEAAGSYQGGYFVLMGHLSPLDGIGPEELQLPLLEKRLKDEQVDEVILATNPTVEGEATAHYIADMVKSLGIKVSRIAHGVPMGGELEYIDGTTLGHAFKGRQSI